MTAALPVAPPAAARTEEQNVLIWPVFGAGALDLSRVTVVEGVLAYPQGGPDGEETGDPRVCAILSLGATITGVGELVAAIIDAAVGGTSTASLPVETVARAILAYNEPYLDAANQDKIRPGFRLTLPIEIDPATDEWMVDRTAMGEWAERITASGVTMLGWSAQSLRLPDPERVRAGAELEIAASASASAIADAWAPRILENPFAVLFEVIELFRLMRGDVYGNVPRAGDEVEFALGLIAQMRDFHLQQLAFATGGNAILRRVWRALDDGDSSTVAAGDLEAGRRRVAAVLGVQQDAPDVWIPITRYRPPRTAAASADAIGPSVVPIELPLTDGQRVGGRKGPVNADGEPTGGRRGMVLGRDMFVGPNAVDSVSYGGGYVYRGPYEKGVVDPIAFARRHAVQIGSDASPLLAKCVHVAVQIAGNEGYIDACRAADRAFISTGMQQWSMHTNTEMTVLLHRFQELAWDHYDLLFGMFGLLPRMCGSSEEAKPPDDASVIAANPDAARATFAGPNFPWHVTLDRLLAGGTPTPMRQPTGAPDTGNPRVAFFDGVVHGKTVDFGNDWSARIRLAGRASIEYGVVQVQTAAYRFKRILDGPGGTPVRGVNLPVAGVAQTLPDLFVSEVAAAAILDQHINAPAFPRADVSTAIGRAQPPRVPPVPTHLPAGGLDPDWLQRYTIDFLAARRFVEDKTKADRDSRIVSLHDNGLSPDTDPPSFPAWP